MSRADDYVRIRDAIDRRAGSTGLLSMDNSNDILKIATSGAGGCSHLILRHLADIIAERQPELLAEVLQRARSEAVNEATRQRDEANKTIEKLAAESPI